MSFSASYLFVGAHHLPHPTDFNGVDNTRLVENFRRCTGRAPTTTSDALGLTPSTASCPNSTALINGIIVINSRGERVVQPAAANFFRPSGPNYFFLQSLGISKPVFDSLLTNSLRTPGLISTYGDVNAQVSDGNSNYNAMNLEVKRRFAGNFQFLASYTWSHAIDDSSDLQTLLLPQDVDNPGAERADSLFDQRHRFVFSGVLAAPGEWQSSGGGMRRFLAGFIVAPIVEISSGRPFNILTGIDTNNDQTEQTDRPNVGADGRLVIPPFLSSGNLGRNRGITHTYAALDLRVMRVVPFGERVRLEVIAEGFNLFNRFNEAATSPFIDDVNAFNQRGPSGRHYSRPTATFDPRQSQFGLKLNF